MIRKKLTRIISVFFLTSALFAGFFIPALAQTASSSYGLNESAGEIKAFSSQVTNPDDSFLTTKVGSIIGIVLSFVGVIFLVLMIFAGLSWMTAQGNNEKVSKAKDLMINAIIGLIIVLAAYAITTYVGNNLT